MSIIPNALYDIEYHQMTKSTSEMEPYAIPYHLENFKPKHIQLAPALDKTGEEETGERDKKVGRERTEGEGRGDGMRRERRRQREKKVGRERTEGEDRRDGERKGLSPGLE
ncbi:hypothetical protein TNCV_1103321 [Trichonephila clavipes]|nr:hypothetical protein TNCV_1103321 [Trichonephila clavipes]